jgi:hypothetical protein
MVPLADSPHAAGLKMSAQQEINALLPLELGGAPGDDLPFQLLGTLAAAAGALSVTDLATITGIKTSIVRGFVRRRAARSLEQVGPVEDRRYQFAHQTLLEYCQQHPDVGGDAQYHDQLHRWAQDWSAKGWPTADMARTSTPTYLLDSYPVTLVGDNAELVREAADPARLADLVSDIGWVDAALSRLGVDPTLATLQIAARVNVAQSPVAAILRLLNLEAYHLRSFQTPTGSAYGATQLAWRALRLGMDDAAKAASDRLRRYPPPQFSPVWTSDHTSAYLVGVLGRDEGGISALAVTGDGRVVSGGGDGAVWLWNPSAPGKRGRELGRHDDWVQTVAVARDGRVISGGRDARVRLWDPAVPGDPGSELGWHNSAVYAVAVTGDGRVVSADGDGAVRLWDVAGDAGLEVSAHYGPVHAVAVTGDGRVVSGGHDGAVRLWDPAVPGDPGRELDRLDEELDRLDEAVYSVAFTGDGRVVSGGGDGAVWLWDLALPDDQGRELGRHDDAVNAAAVTRDGRILCGPR